jgi:hypothetical protein
MCHNLCGGQSRGRTPISCQVNRWLLDPLPEIGLRAPVVQVQELPGTRPFSKELSQTTNQRD